MARSCLTFLLTASVMTATSAAAHAQAIAPVPSATTVVLVQPAPASATDVAAIPNGREPQSVAQLRTATYLPPTNTKRPRSLVPLYAGLVALQGYDTYSTLTGLRHGAVEANPLMAGPARQPAAFVVLKSVTTAGSIYAAEHLWRTHRKGAAIALIAITDGFLAVVAAHNASVLRTQRTR